MKAISDTLGVARSNVIERRDGARAQRGPQERPGDVELAGVIRRFVDERPTYGYRRIAALLKRERRADSMAPVNAKRVYRLMKRHGLLLARHTGRRRPREHDGQVATLRSNIRWCSDGREFTCWNGEVVRVTFALDCHDREVIGWVATTAGIRRDDPRHDGSLRRAALRHDTRTAPAAMALRQRLDLRRPQNHRNRRGTQPSAVLHAGRKPGKQRHGGGFRQNLQARLCPGQPDPRCRHSSCSRRYLDEGLQHGSRHSPREYILSQPVACPVQRGQLHR